MASPKPKTSDGLLSVEWIGAIVKENHGHTFNRYTNEIPLGVYEQSDPVIGRWLCDHYGVPRTNDVVKAGNLSQFDRNLYNCVEFSYKKAYC